MDRKELHRKRFNDTLEASGVRIGQRAAQAAEALCAHLAQVEAKKNANALLPEPEPVYVYFQMVQSLPLRKTKAKHGVVLPHPIYTRDDQEVCLITTSPQSKWKGLVRGKEGLENIKKIIDINKLRKKFKAYEDKRRLMNGFNCFLTDEAVVPFLPKILGTTFFDRKKEPFAVKMRSMRYLQLAMRSTFYSIADSSCFAVLIGRTDFTPQQLGDNACAVIDDVILKRCPGAWADVLTISIRGAQTAMLPIYAHRFSETKEKPPQAYDFPKRIRLELPEEAPQKKRPRDDDDDDEMEPADAGNSDDEEDEALDEMEAISDVDDEEDEEDEA